MSIFEEVLEYKKRRRAYINEAGEEFDQENAHILEEIQGRCTHVWRSTGWNWTGDYELFTCTHCLKTKNTFVEEK